MHIFRRFVTIIEHVIKSLENSCPIMLQEFVEYSADLDKLREQKLNISLPDLWTQIKDQVEYRGRV